MTPYVARWDLDKTYLRTEFGTMRDLLRTAFERAEKKRTVPGAAALLREIAQTGASIHIISGSPEQLRSRLEEKLRLDGARWETLTLKPNLRNVLRLRFRALREQLGYKLPVLLTSRARMLWERDPRLGPPREVLVGDDAESDALIYSLYADVLGGRVGITELEDVLLAVHAYDDAISDAVRYARLVDKGDTVDRILIHLDRQTPPSEFLPYGARVVPFFNYLQAAFVLEQDGLLPAAAVVRVAAELVLEHGFDGRALGRSYLDLVKRGHLTASGAPAILEAYRALKDVAPVPAAGELEQMARSIREVAGTKGPALPTRRPDYRALARSLVSRR